MSPTKTNIFILGATGYIGGSVLNRFLNRPDAASLNFTALVRSAEKAEKFQQLGVNAVVGSHTDVALVEKLASEADVVLSIADCDYLPAAQAFLKGLENRFKATGNVPILIHTISPFGLVQRLLTNRCAGVLIDDAAGAFAGETIYDDTNPDQIETLAPSQPHRIVDLAIVKADKEGYVKTYIILPSTIYGLVSNKLVDLGIQNPHSIQIPALIDASLARGQGGMVGQGKNIWPNVHIDDGTNVRFSISPLLMINLPLVVDLYIVLYDSIKNNPATGHGREGFYFGENDEYTLYQIGKTISEVLVEMGKGKSPEPTTFSKEEIDKYFGGSAYLGTNSRCRANRSRAIGWKPTKTTADMLASIKPEVTASLHRRAVPLR
ncbi:hypothetical protein C0995_000372 [Termitomyces sp. Mi166|nr:hypothetical protein C0995_000372 [Termitomyces sp. Mi166\